MIFARSASFVLLLAAGCQAAAAAPAPPPESAEAAIARKTSELHASWKERLAEEKFNAVVAPPFLIAGNGTPQQLAGYRDRTIVAAARALKAMYFKTELPEPVLILLFESEGPYRKLAKKWFDDADVPHYGFYRHSTRTMLMNVGTGTGTLVHELVHALIAPDFPAVPDWFNEGIASLYEQCSIDGDTIRGHANWRLPALQKAIQDGKLRSLPDMIGDADFRNGERVGINYAQARYLMFYLQEKGLLRKFYEQFKTNHEKDPTGLATLKSVVGPQELDAFEKDWREWVLTLRFR